MIALLLALAAVTFPAGARTTLSVELGAGDVRIAGSDRNGVEVDAQRASASLDGDRIIIRGDDLAGPPNRAARASVGVKLPAGLPVEVRILDGRLTLEALRGRVAADVRQGEIRASGVSGVVRLETGFGDVHVERARLTAAGLLRLRAFNGNVRLELEDLPPNARILALTFNGRIESSLPLARRESFGPKFAEATFGSGEPVISLDSVTGNITIIAAASRRR